MTSSFYVVSCSNHATNLNPYGIINDTDSEIKYIIESIGGYILLADEDYKKVHVVTDNLMSKLTYFNEKKIQICKISANHINQKTFFISTKNKVYSYDRFGKIKLISSLKKKDVFDIQGALSGQIALCFNTKQKKDTRWSLWRHCYSSELSVPQEIIDIIADMCVTTMVYYKKNKSNWKGISTFNDKLSINIIKMAVSCTHNLFLDENGVVWFSIDEYCGAAGFPMNMYHNNDVSNVTTIDYFIDNDIKIIDIECGFAHSLALSEDGLVYSWGFNGWGECGHGDTERIFEPKLIDALKGEIVNTIKCGAQHSYCKTIDKHFIWGSNEQHECLAADNNSIISIPVQVDQYISLKCDNKKIESAYLGYFKTILECR